MFVTSSLFTSALSEIANENADVLRKGGWQIKYSHRQYFLQKRANLNYRGCNWYWAAVTCVIVVHVCAYNVFRCTKVQVYKNVYEVYTQKDLYQEFEFLKPWMYALFASYTQIDRLTDR